MHSLWLTGRFISRAIFNGIANVSTAAEPGAHHRRREPRLVSAVCGFSKERQLQIDRLKGKFGDDAWFAAKHKTGDVLGVADGVGGWRAYGIDPGDFSFQLMQACERLANQGQFIPTNPTDLLSKSFFELFHSRKRILGSSTACVMVLNRENSTLYTTNIGDSGYMVVRRGRVIRKSEEQQHYFNTPFQLSLPPPAIQADVLSDNLESAATDNFPVEDGDVILLATDGVFDNLPQTIILDQLIKVQGERCASRLQMVANTIAWMARNLSYDDNFFSPFAERARQSGIDTIGGKPDDITVLLATVAI